MFKQMTKVVLSGLVVLGILLPFFTGLGSLTTEAATNVGPTVLLREHFYYNGTTGGLSGWVIDSTAGTYAGSTDKGLVLKDESEDSCMQVRKEFARQTGNTLSAEIFYRRSGTMSTAFMLLDGDVPVIKIGTMGKHVGYVTSDGSFHALWEYSKACRIKIDVDLAQRKFTIYQNGQLVKDGLPFFASRNTVNGVLFRTSTEEVGNAQVDAIMVYTDYDVYDTYLTVAESVLPTGYTVSGGTAGCVSTDGHGLREAMILQTKPSGNGQATLTRSFDKVNGKKIVRFLLGTGDKTEGTAARLMNGNTAMLEFAVKDGTWAYKSGNTYKAMTYEGSMDKTYTVSARKNSWYDFRVEMNTSTGKADVYVNYKKIASGLAVSNGLDALQFVTASGTALGVEDVLVYDDVALPSDYVKAPAVPQKATDALVGVQTCDLWLNGIQLGWEATMALPDNEQLLGTYDDDSTEVWDWKIKQMVECGADFFFACWYENWETDTQKYSLVAPQYSVYMDAYFGAEYTDYLNFAIQVYGPYYSLDNYKENIIPYWVDYYFTDPHYQLVDNRPIIGVGSPEELRDTLGGKDKVTAFLKALDEACRKAGFDGVYVLAQEHPDQSGTLSLDMGFDGGYNYNGKSDWNKNKQNNEDAYNKLKNTGTAWIPTLSVGWSNETQVMDGVLTPNVNRMSVEDYKKQALWMRDFSNSLPDSSLSSKLILVDNWSEIMEGHSVQPTLTRGWGYFDGLAAAFTKTKDLSSLHVAPTEAQKARLNLQYPKSWNGKVWDFDYSLNITEFWHPGSGLTGLCNDTKGHLRGLVDCESGQNGYIECIGGQHIDAATKRIELSIKNQGDCNALKVYFVTDTSKEFSEDKCFYIALRPEDENFSTYVIDTTKNKNWKGKITQLRVLFEVPKGGVGGLFFIDYIRVLKSSGIATTPLAGEVIKRLQLPYAYELLEPESYYFTPVYQEFSAGATKDMLFTLTGRVTGRNLTGYTIKLDAGSPVSIAKGEFTFANVATGRHVLYVYDNTGMLVNRRQFVAKVGSAAAYSGSTMTVTETGKAPTMTIELSAQSPGGSSSVGATTAPGGNGSSGGTDQTKYTGDDDKPDVSAGDLDEPDNSSGQSDKPLDGDMDVSGKNDADTPDNSLLLTYIGIGIAVAFVAGAAIFITVFLKKQKN